MAKKTTTKQTDTQKASRIGEYEVMIVLKPLLPDDIRSAINKSIVDTVEQLGGKVVETDVWGKRYLAYPIMSHKEGYYILYNVDMPTSNVAELERQLRLKQEILRFLVVKRDKYSKVSNNWDSQQSEQEEDDAKAKTRE